MMRDTMSSGGSGGASSSTGQEERDSDRVLVERSGSEGRGSFNHKDRSKSSSRSKEKRKKKSYFVSSSLSSIPNRIQLSMLSSGLITITEEEKALRSMSTKPVLVKEFPRVCQEHRKYPILFKVEFQMSSKVETHSVRHASKEVNEIKNQNKRTIPYDYNRVVLEPSPDVPDSDYINASYIDSLLTPMAYIVTQGPTENTIKDFWRMIWQENVRLIIMLTKTFDFIKVMCVQYWPANIGIVDEYFDLRVRYTNEEQLANFVVRTVTLSSESSKEEREIVQFQYTTWPSHTQPFINALIEFRRRVQLWKKECLLPSYGPVLVHCSDGGCRSGLWVAIESNMDLFEEDGVIDIYGCVKKLREGRRNMVENVDQYRFIYDCLEEFITCGYTFFPVSELSQVLKEKSMKGENNKNAYQLEYEQICRMTPRFTIGECAGGHRIDNRFKNRNVLCVPPDNFRPYLTSFQGNTCTDYINAVFVDGYLRTCQYAVAEWPLRATTADLWSLVYDHDITSLVVLCNPSPSEAAAYPPFWPEKQKSVKYGPVFTVDNASHQFYQNIRSWLFKVHKKIVSLTELMAGVKAEPKQCQLFQLMCWPQGHKVPTSTNAFVELMNMVERWRQKRDYGSVLVISTDGMSRAGVYCAANACIEQVVKHKEVDVYQAVKTVRRHRPQLINSMTEYKYCYDVVLHYVLHFLQKEDLNRTEPVKNMDMAKT